MTTDIAGEKIVLFIRVSDENHHCSDIMAGVIKSDLPTGPAVSQNTFGIFIAEPARKINADHAVALKQIRQVAVSKQRFADLDTESARFIPLLRHDFK